MRIWFITVGEPLPTDTGTPRLLRAGLLSRLATERGHEVTWWSSAFDHQSKSFREPPPALLAPAHLGYELILLRGCGYKRNVSVARIRDHRQTAAEFERLASGRPAPDVILCSYPTVELCEAAVAYGRAHGVPVVVDLRDLWPDIFLNLAPTWAQAALRLVLSPMFRASRRACAGAASITGITNAFVDWGVHRAGRVRHDLDRAFSLAYAAQLPDPAALASARQQWDRLGLPSGTPIACFFGTLGRQFDIPSLIQAAKLLTDTPLQMVICGSGDRLGEFRQLGRDVANLHFPGWVDAAAIRALMERSLVGLAPYFNERSFTMSIPNKAIEYLAGGLPVVSTLSGELQQLLQQHDCGITVAEGHVEALAIALRALCADGARRQQMARSAHALYESQFVMSNVYGRFIDHLTEVAQQAQRRHPGS